MQTICALYICKYQANIYFIILSESFPGLRSNFPEHWQKIDLLNSKKVTIFSSDYDRFYPPCEAWKTSKIIFAPTSSLQSLKSYVPHSGLQLAWSRDMCPCSREWCQIGYLHNTFFPVFDQELEEERLIPFFFAAESCNQYLWPQIVRLYWMHYGISHQLQCFWQVSVIFKMALAAGWLTVLQTILLYKKVQIIVVLKEFKHHIWSASLDNYINSNIKSMTWM